MKHAQLFVIALLGLTLTVTGCGKKSSDQASLSGTGFDSLSSTEELAQLPQSTTSNQQTSVEVLPIETAPVTQSASVAGSTLNVTATDFSTATSSSISGLSREQQIQTALKGAGIYQGNIDGKIGPKTKKAIEEFQTSQGLKVDGKVGPKTWAALQLYLSTGNGTATVTSSTD